MDIQAVFYNIPHYFGIEVQVFFEKISSI